jgi:hypothetical protein
MNVSTGKLLFALQEKETGDGRKGDRRRPME